MKPRKDDKLSTPTQEARETAEGACYISKTRKFIGRSELGNTECKVNRRSGVRMIPVKSGRKSRDQTTSSHNRNENQRGREVSDTVLTYSIGCDAAIDRKAKITGIVAMSCREAGNRTKWHDGENAAEDLTYRAAP